MKRLRQPTVREAAIGAGGLFVLVVVVNFFYGITIRHIDSIDNSYALLEACKDPRVRSEIEAECKKRELRIKRGFLSTSIEEVVDRVVLAFASPWVVMPTAFAVVYAVYSIIEYYKHARLADYLRRQMAPPSLANRNIHENHHYAIMLPDRE